MSKAEKFLELQRKVNQEIDELGQATDESINELEAFSDKLDDEDMYEVIELLSRNPDDILKQ